MQLSAVERQDCLRARRLPPMRGPFSIRYVKKAAFLQYPGALNPANGGTYGLAVIFLGLKALNRGATHCLNRPSGHYSKQDRCHS